MGEKESTIGHQPEDRREHPHYPYLGVQEKLRRIWIEDLSNQGAVEQATNALYTGDIRTALLINTIDSATDGTDIMEIAALHDVIAENEIAMGEVKEWIAAFSSLLTHHTIERIRNDALSNPAQRGVINIGMTRDELWTRMFVEPGRDRDSQSLRETLIKLFKTHTYNNIYDAVNAVIAPLETHGHPAYELVTLIQKLLNVEKKALYPLRTHIARGGITGSNVYYDALLLIPELIFQRHAPFSNEEQQHVRAVYNNSSPLFGHLAFGPIERTAFIEEAVSDNRPYVLESRFLPECFEVKKHPLGPLHECLMLKKEVMERLRNPEILEQFIETKVQEQRDMTLYTAPNVSREVLEQELSKVRELFKSMYRDQHPMDHGPAQAYMCAAAHADALKTIQKIIGDTWEYYYVPLANNLAMAG